MNRNFWEKSAELIVIAAYIMGLLGALTIVGWQVFQWLRTGVWIPIPISEGFAYLGIDLTWVYMPADWQGLAKVVQWLLEIPLAIGAPATLITAAHILQELVSDINK